MERMNEWLTLLTNIGVIAGLAILIYEINQNTNALQNETDVGYLLHGAGQPANDVGEQ